MQCMVLQQRILIAATASLADKHNHCREQKFDSEFQSISHMRTRELMKSNNVASFCPKMTISFLDFTMLDLPIDWNP